MKKILTVGDFARGVLDLEREVTYLRQRVAELEEYEQKYLELLQSGITHNQKMIGGMLSIALIPGVTAAISAHNKAGATFV